MAERDPALQSWLLDKSYTNMYLIRGGSHWTGSLEFKICKSKAVPIPMFAQWHNLKTFAVIPNDPHWPYLSAPAFWQI